ncbi:hypothetical protein ADL02_03455 [Streptomyces sp. NRRL WC-3723]|nr:hypothetical protein ADL02_03455 [Streptomyces sp. NRRL WC-3723]
MRASGCRTAPPISRTVLVRLVTIRLLYLSSSIRTSRASMRETSSVTYGSHAFMTRSGKTASSALPGSTPCWSRRYAYSALIPSTTAAGVRSLASRKGGRRACQMSCSWSTG